MDNEYQNLSLIERIGNGTCQVMVISTGEELVVPLKQSAASGVAIGDLVLLTDDHDALQYK